MSTTLVLDLYTDLYQPEAARVWVPYKGINPSCWFVDKDGTLQFGAEDGYIYKFEGWSDDGAGFKSIYTTRAFGEAEAQRFKKIRVRFKKTEGEINVRYRVGDGHWKDNKFDAGRLTIRDGVSLYKDIPVNEIGETIQVQVEHEDKHPFEIEYILIESYLRRVRA